MRILSDVSVYTDRAPALGGATDDGAFCVGGVAVQNRFHHSAVGGEDVLLHEALRVTHSVNSLPHG